MRAKRKRSWILAGIVAMTFICAGLGFAAAESEAGMDEPVTVTMAWPNHQAYPWNPEWPVTKYIEEQLNINLEAEAIPFQEYDTKLVLLMSAGTFPDLSCATGTPSYIEGVKADLLLPVTPYLDEMPNLSALIEERGGLTDLLFALGELDGELYRFPSFLSQRPGTQSWWIRQDIFDANGWDTPTTAEEVGEALIAIEETYPETVGLTAVFGPNHVIQPTRRMFNVPSDQSPTPYFFLDRDTDTWVCEADTDNMKAAIQYWADLFDAGALDPEILSQEASVGNAKFRDGRSMLFHSWMNALADYPRDVADTNPDYSVMPIGFPPSETYGGYSWARASADANYFFLVMKSAAEQDNFPKILEFLDFLYSDKGVELTNFGIEGESFEYDAGTGLPRVTDAENTDPATGMPNGDYAGAWGTNVWPWKAVYTDSFFHGESPVIVDFYATEAQRMIRPAPNVLMSADERDDFSLLHQPLGDYIQTEYIKFMFGQRPMSEWDAFLDECRAKGMDQITDWLNEYYQRQKGM